MEKTFENLLLLATWIGSFVAILEAQDRATTVYLMPPAGYEYKIDKLVTVGDHAQDDFSRALNGLKGRLQEAGYDLVTTSLDRKLTNFAGLIACNLPEGKLKKLKKYPKHKLIFLVQEPPTATAPYYEQVYYKNFGKVFTLQDNYNDGKYVKYFYPIESLEMQDSLVPFSKRKLCTLVSTKTLLDEPQLYSERARLIRFFETHAPQDFDLYGLGWNQDEHPSFKETDLPKNELLKNYKFCICFENSTDIKGYVTSKIFEAFKAGCIPVYWGAPNITDYVPVDCFIDKRAFASSQALYEFLTSVTQKQYDAYLTRIKDFLKSSQAQRFSQASFVDLMLTHLGASPVHDEEELHISYDQEEGWADAHALTRPVIGGQQTVSAGSAALLTAVAEGGNGPLYYRWSDGQQGHDVNAITVSPTKTTEYTVTVTDSSDPAVELTSFPFTLNVERAALADKPEELENEEMDNEELNENFVREPTAQEPALDESATYESDVADEQPSQEQDYLEERLEDESLLAALSITGERVYRNGQIIQLQAHPEGFAYQWSGPNNFASTAPRISLVAKPSVAGIYRVQAQSATGTKSARAEILVLGSAPVVKQPAVVKSASVVVEPAKAVNEPATSKGAHLLIKTNNCRIKDDMISFTVNVTNVGKEKAMHVTVTDALPPCLSFISAEGSGWTIKTSRNELLAKLRSLAVNERKTIDVSARILFKPDFKVRNTATVVSDTTAPCDSVAHLF